MSNLTKVEPNIEALLTQGDLKSLSSSERASYYMKLCESLGLNPLTQPFEYVSFQGKMKLYAKKDCADQLRKIYGVSVEVTSRMTEEGVYSVTVRATTSDGRRDEDIGAVSVAGKKGDDLANMLMKATTKAKRRVTLSICGLGFLDESELETIPGDVQKVTVTQAHASADTAFYDAIVAEMASDGCDFDALGAKIAANKDKLSAGQLQSIRGMWPQ